MNLALVCPRGKRGSASVLDGTAAMTARVPSAVRGIFAIAAIVKLQASAMTADISNTWLLRWKHSRQYRRV